MARRRKTKGSLQRYYAKRHFEKTPEPRGKVRAREGRAFVIQKHGARRLHYDFRLEWDGTLKSWAVPKGPSLDPGDKRLAVRVEDHPLDYGGFEGVIPEGEYGAGPVIIWDRGTWEPEGEPAKADAKGRLNFTMHGEKMHGAWALVRIGGGPYGARDKSSKQNWLLIKRTDDAAQRGKGDVLVTKQPNSVASGRSLEDVRAGKGKIRTWHSNRPKRNGTGNGHAKPKRARRRAAAKDEDMPDFVPPELAVRVEKPPAGDDWLHEVKFDGYRIQARIDAGAVKLLTRTGLDWTDKFRALIPELQSLDCENAIIDGEVVALDADGVSDFSRLQEALSEGDEKALYYYAFDLLYRDGETLTGRPLERRKESLAALMRPLGDKGRVRMSEHFKVEGDAFFRHVCSLALEGAISKRADAPYTSGRSGNWQKSKCVERQEMVIVGFTPSTTGPGTIGSLILGQHQDGKLVYSGRVGTGFTHKSARMLHKRLSALRTGAAPVVAPAGMRKDARWVKPELVAEIEFVGWTADRIVRHGAFKGLREDKAAAEVTPEAPRKAMASSARSAKAAKGREKLFSVLSHPDRVLYDAQGITKLGLAEYYAEVAELMVPHVRDRPLSLVRCPGGTTGECFYQKSIPQGTPDVHEVHNTARGKKETYPAIRDVKGLIGLTQMGTLELHIWGCKAAKIMTPDRIVFDVDPDEGMAWERVIAAAFEIRDRLKAIGLTSFLKTTGGKGLHVAAPIAPKHDWDTVKAFTKAFASAMMHDAPDRYVVTISKKARKGKIFIDYLRNGYGATFVAPYSPRARSNAPISMPLEWKELTPALRSDHFRLENVAARLKAMKHDPWRDMLKLRQSITAKMLKQFGVAA
jgi:bifunctional non-homologous end joining protein LigD